MSNSKLHPEAWAFYTEHARNMEEEDESTLGKYRIPQPDGSGNFIYAGSVEELWSVFIQEWYKPSLNSPSIRGKIQYITQNF